MSFKKLSRNTLIAVYILILVGGIVRSTGAGMGCPDWPQCFGQWVPPTSVDELPSDYKQISLAHRQEKNQRFVKFLSAIGLSETATKILDDPTVQEEEDFNPLKTWIEYVNRIVGVIIGLLIFALFITSIQFWKQNRNITVIAFLTFVCVGIQGWFGSIVVSTNLTPWTITIHMFLALVIVAMLIYLMNFSIPKTKQHAPMLFWWSIAGMVVILMQILFGTQVREAIDAVSASFPRSEWISNLGGEFFLHRTFSWLVLAINGALFYLMYKTEAFRPFSIPLILLILSTVLSGVGMAYGGVPPFLQPLHLVLASIIFGIQFIVFLQVGIKKQTKITA